MPALAGGILSRRGNRCCFVLFIIDDELALLRYFRTLGTGSEHSIARYFMTEVPGGTLWYTLGVRYLFDDTSPFRLNNGLRHFQRMIRLPHRSRPDRTPRSLPDWPGHAGCFERSEDPVQGSCAVPDASGTRPADP